jgi:hypothetical protein
MQVAGSLVNNKSKQDGIEIAEFYLPVGNSLCGTIPVINGITIPKKESAGRGYQYP